MAIWKIPNEYKIGYSPNGDDVDSFSQKVKYCLEAAFDSLEELHNTTSSLSSAISASNKATLPVQIENPQDGQILVYHSTAKKFLNEPNNPVGESKTLTLLDGNNVLLEYNGNTAASLDVRDAINQASVSQELLHLTRLVENLYLALDVMELDPGGYDGLIGETFYGTLENIDTSRSSGIVEGEMLGDGTTLVTKPIFFTNAVGKAHLVVKHQNVADAEIKAEIALYDADFVKGEILGIGNGLEQTVYLTHTNNLAPHFAVYFDGVEPTTGSIAVDDLTGEVTFIAPAGAIVSIDYFYNWGLENFVEMEKTRTYPDHRNTNRATTQFTYSGTAKTVATLRLTLNRGTGHAQREIVSVGTGKSQAFKLAHQANPAEIEVAPSTAIWSYDENQNVIVVNAPIDTEFSVSYWWKGKSFSMDSFACIFNE